LVSPGWSYPRSKSGENRSYSCRRFLLWHSGLEIRSNLGPFETRGRPDCYTGNLRIYARSWRNQSDRFVKHTIIGPSSCNVSSFRDACVQSALYACKSSSLCCIILGWPASAAFNSKMDASDRLKITQPQSGSWDIQP
jgi:hypothetical protein